MACARSALANTLWIVTVPAYTSTLPAPQLADHLPLRRHLPIDDADVLRVGADLTHQRAVTGHAGTHVLPVGSRRQLVSRRRVGPAVGSAIPHHGPALAAGDRFNLAQQALAQRALTDPSSEVGVVVALVGAGLAHDTGAGRIPRTDVAAAVHQSAPEVEPGAGGQAVQLQSILRLGVVTQLHRAVLVGAGAAPDLGPLSIGGALWEPPFQRARERHRGGRKRCQRRRRRGLALDVC
ncbi:hypothetical protein G6F22_016410 [Rhizopus arrhizus]|nr:hypothetical protein G6F22_016410 [Rhizopus arrhizus]